MMINKMNVQCVVHQLIWDRTTIRPVILMGSAVAADSVVSADLAVADSVVLDFSHFSHSSCSVVLDVFVGFN
ncbi:MAG TPA: hypothetical protein VN379_20425 [Sporomusa sp.]|jgi:hypothetical protein|nr:hypothetical protein [Sporomusa sp.]